nr:MAG TPA: hypothetical protein [Caudoviricetes sp.]DAO61260.1 MAG TPA: hypothetical protein [Bacteriophage sp.]DAZ77031.1 MAG TPA: hypothetical protein [Caudoviricetes sp.]
MSMFYLLSSFAYRDISSLSREFKFKFYVKNDHQKVLIL